MSPLSRGVLFLALACFALEWSASIFGTGGYFSDEFYYLACADRLAFGYVDHPPLSILVLQVARALVGDSLAALRLVPALAGAATVILTGLIALRLGSDGFGQVLAAAAVVAAPVYQTIFGFYSMNALSMLIWAGCFLILIEIERRDEPRLWVAFGLLAGIGLQNKHTIALLAVGLAVGLLLSPARRHLASRWLWVGLGAALLLALPNLLWQASEGWPSLAFYTGQDRKNIPTSPLAVLAGQVVVLNPLTLPIWLAGLVFLLGTERGRPYRHLGWTYVVLLGLMLVGGKSRPDRITPAYTVLLAAGGTLLGNVFARPRWRRLHPALPAAVLAAGAALAPATLPLLPPDLAARYVAALGIVPRIERSERSQLPLWLAERYEWERFVDDVSDAAASLDSNERSRAIILTPDYVRASSIEFLGRVRELPPVYSGHNSYFFWGPPRKPVDVVVAAGFGDPGPTGPVPEAGLASLFEEIDLFRVYDCTWCSSWRDQTPIWIARRPRQDVREAWPRVKRFR